MGAYVPVKLAPGCFASWVNSTSLKYILIFSLLVETFANTHQPFLFYLRGASLTLLQTATAVPEVTAFPVIIYDKQQKLKSITHKQQSRNRPKEAELTAGKCYSLGASFTSKRPWKTF